MELINQLLVVSVITVRFPSTHIINVPFIAVKAPIQDANKKMFGLV